MLQCVLVPFVKLPTLLSLTNTAHRTLGRVFTRERVWALPRRFTGARVTRGRVRGWRGLWCGGGGGGCGGGGVCVV